MAQLVLNQETATVEIILQSCYLLCGFTDIGLQIDPHLLIAKPNLNRDFLPGNQKKSRPNVNTPTGYIRLSPHRKWPAYNIPGTHLASESCPVDPHNAYKIDTRNIGSKNMIIADIKKVLYQ
jgi:hypothetical protein